MTSTTGDRAVSRAGGASKGVIDVSGVATAARVRGAVVGAEDVGVVAVTFGRGDTFVVNGVTGVGDRGVVVAEGRERTFVRAGLGAGRAAVVVVAVDRGGAITEAVDVAEGVCGVSVSGPAGADQLAVAGEGAGVAAVEGFG